MTAQTEQKGIEKRVKKPRDWDRPAFFAAIAGLIMTTFDFIWAFTISPMVNGASLTGDAVVNINGMIVSNVQLFSQKIFYVHVSVAVAALIFIVIAAVYSILYLVKKQARFDLRARTCFEVGLVFIIATMGSGDLWTRIEWGVWWVWEPRLTTYLILTLLVIAYFILRAAIDDPEKKARFCSVFGIIAAIDAPISYMITRLIPSSLHPVLFRSDSGLPPKMLIPFLVGLFGMSFLAFGLYRLRLRVLEQSVEVEELKRRYES